MPLPLEVIDFIRRRLDHAKALQPCKTCGCATFDIAEDMFFHVMCLPSPMPQQVNIPPTPRGTPTVAIVCTTCGAMTFHSLKKLAILDEVNRRSMEIWQRTLQQSQMSQQGPLQSTQPAQMVVYMQLECFNCHSASALSIAPKAPNTPPTCPKCGSTNIRYSSMQDPQLMSTQDPNSEAIFEQAPMPAKLYPITKPRWDTRCHDCTHRVQRHLPGACKIDASGRCVCPPHRTHQCGRTTKKCAK